MTQSRKSFRPGALLSLLRRVLPPISLLMLTVAGIVNAFGVVLFLSPVALYDSGISGTSMLFAQIARGIIPFSLFLILLNVPLFLYGLRREGATFTIRSIYTVVIYSLAAAFFGRFVTPGASPIAGSDLLLCAIFGGLISGVGSGTTIRYGGALDGIEVLAVIFSRRLGMTVGTFVMTYNALLYVVAGVIMGSWVLPLYSIVTYAAALKAVDYMVEGFDRCKAAMIVTVRPREICAALTETFSTGITRIEARGGYSGQDRDVLYFVVNRFQIARLRDIVHELDPTAYITISEVADIFRGNS